MILNMTGKGGGGTILVSDTQDAAGGTIRTITAKKVVSLQTKTITPTSSVQTVNPDTGYDGFSQVMVNAGGSNDLIVSLSFDDSALLWVPDKTVSEISQAYYGGKEIVTVCGDSSYIDGQVSTTGYYVPNFNIFEYVVAERDLHTANYEIAWFSMNSSGSINLYDRGTYSLLSLQSKTVTPTTYTQNITPDASYDGLEEVIVNAMPSGSVTAPSSISGTSATVTTGTNTLTLTKSVSVTPNVTTAGYISSGTAGSSSVSLTASVTTKAAATITPGTTNQTIASGTYLTGTQTIAGDADLVASNIVSGVQIFGVTGNVVLQNYYTGSSAPSSSLGANGDLYLQV